MDNGVKLHITSEKNVSIDYVVNEATTIWRAMRSKKIASNEAADAFMSEIWNAHPEFCKAYPIVARYICQMQEYNERVFRAWLMKIKERPWTTEGEYLDAQASYIVMLYRKKYPRATKTEINNLRKNTRAILHAEHEKFKNLARECERQVAAVEDMLRSKNQDELREFAKIAGSVGLSKAETFRVETDIVPAQPIDIDSLVQNVHSAHSADTADSTYITDGADIAQDIQEAPTRYTAADLLM